jgi:hypothetical protein
MIWSNVDEDGNVEVEVGRRGMIVLKKEWGVEGEGEKEEVNTKNK